MTLRGPMLVKQLAVYHPLASDPSQWALVSGWDNQKATLTQGITFDGKATRRRKLRRGGGIRVHGRGLVGAPGVVRRRERALLSGSAAEQVPRLGRIEAVRDAGDDAPRRDEQGAFSLLHGHQRQLV